MFVQLSAEELTVQPEFITTTYVTFDNGDGYCPPIEVPNRSIDAALKLAEDRGFRFYFFEIVSCDLQYGCEPLHMESWPIHQSVVHYTKGCIYTLAEIEAQFPTARDLIHNIKQAPDQRGIQLPSGSWQLCEEGAVLAAA
jgi:hypothetical protein